MTSSNMSIVIFFLPNGMNVTITGGPVPRAGEEVFFNGLWDQWGISNQGWKVVKVRHVYHRFQDGRISHEAHVYVEPEFDLTQVDLKS